MKLVKITWRDITVISDWTDKEEIDKTEVLKDKVKKRESKANI